ncbi:MAG: hypothetical protein FJ145_02190 [Deltaproteobacteria bacterium]|nr:hypothetical protein [Deltaproteobacteria bacterium]
MKTQLLKGIALGLFVSTMASPLFAQTAAPAQQAAEPAAGEELGYGVGSVLANVIYMPAKITYAGLGLLAGGLSYVLSAGRADVANNIIYPSVKGNYVVTPSHLKGTDPLYFVGAAPEQAPVQNYASGPAAAPKR